MEIPVQGNPQHQGDLPGGRDRLLEVGGGRVGNARDVDGIILKSRLGKGVDVGFAQEGRVQGRLDACPLLVARVDDHGVCAVGDIFSVYHDCPPDGEERLVMLVELMALEEQAGKDGLDSECLPVWQVDRRGNHGGGVWLEVQMRGSLLGSLGRDGGSWCGLCGCVSVKRQ